MIVIPRLCGALALALVVMTQTCVLAADPVATLPGSICRRIGAAAGDSTASYVIRTGDEVLEWDVADIAPGMYGFELTVRTGNTGSNALNLVHLYRVWAVAGEGPEGDAIGFVQTPGVRPRKTSEQWPHFVGSISSVEPLRLEPGMRLRATAKAYWSEVREVRIYAAPERSLLSFKLSTPQRYHLYRAGHPMEVSVAVRSHLPEAVTAVAELVLESPYGRKESPATRQQLSIPAGRTSAHSFTFRSSQNGCHIASLEVRWKDYVYREEIPLGVVSVATAHELAADSPFAVHPGGLTEMYQAGFKWVRLWDSGDVWCHHEREGKGQFDFSATEQKVTTFLDQGFRVLAVLAYSPAWASRHPEIGYYCGGGAPFPPRDIRDWRDYCREYMTRFKGRIQHFEVWNEPNTGNEVNLNSGFFRGTVKDYVDLLRVAYEVSREVDPEVKVVGCSGTGDFLSWTDAVLAAGGGAYMDILSFHAYTTPRSPEEANLEGRLDRLHQIMQTHGVAHLPIWNTEVGYWQDRRSVARPATGEQLLAKAPPDLAPNWTSSWPYRPIIEADAAAFAVRHYCLNLAKGVEKLFWYSSVSSGQPLLCWDSSLRLACFGIANAAQQLDGFKYWRRIDLGLTRLHLHLWRRDGAVKAVAWHAGDGVKEVVFPHDAGLRAGDIWGNAATLTRAEEGSVLKAGRDPVFLQASAAFFDAARLRTHRLVIPVDDCFVVREVNPERPVKNHTSPAHHGPRRVYGLPDVGDALGWRLSGIRAGMYDVGIELRTGTKDAMYASLGWYEVQIVSGGERQTVRLVPATDAAERPLAITTKEGGNRAYGWACLAEPVFLGPGSEVQVALCSGFGFVGSLRLSEAADSRRVFRLTALADRPVLDGILAETAALHGHELGSRKQVVIGVADPFASTADGDAWRGPTDMSATFWIARAEAGLYVAVDVVDGGGLFPAERGPYNGDCVELFLDLRAEPDVGSPVMGDGLYQLMLRAPAGAGERAVEGKAMAGTQVRAWSTDSGWAAELLIPVAGLTGGRQFGFDVAVDDDDSGKGRKTQIVWHGSSQNFQDPSVYGRFRVE